MPVPIETRVDIDSPLPRRKNRRRKPVSKEPVVPRVPIPIFIEGERIQFPQITPLSLLRIERVINTGSKEPIYPDESDQALLTAYDNLSASPPDPKTVDSECLDALDNFLPILRLQTIGKLPKPVYGNDAQIVADWLARNHTERVIQAGIRFLKDFPTSKPNYDKVRNGYETLQDMQLELNRGDQA